MLYVALGVYLVVAGFGVASVYLLLRSEYVEYAVQVLIALFGFVGVCGSVSISFYSWKAKAENEIGSSNQKYRDRLQMAKQVCDNLKEQTISGQSVALLKELISDNDCNCIHGRAETNVVETEQTAFTVDDILNDMEGQG
ncbi:MAG: hypothetical protein NC084_12535 [Bacteroides sp.]|nr:hypothetical protein [Bacteroides sp.]